MLRSHVLAATAALTLCSPAATAPANAAGSAELKTYLRQSMEAWRVPGMAVAVIEDGDLTLLEGYGVRDVDTKQPVTPDTLFVAASTTKAFTSLGIGMLVDDGAFEWDQAVSAYLPDFVLAEDQRTNSVTVRDMLSHRTGLPRHDLLWYGNDDLSRADLVERLRYLEANVALRTRWQYNNLMYLTAGYIIEQFSGKSWEDYTRDEILAPLAMTRTNFSVADTEKDGNHATPYKLDEQRQVVRIPFRNVDALGPAGSINSSARDLANWVRLHLGDGTFDARRVVAAATLKEVHAAQIPLGAEPEFAEFSAPLYGMGWFVDSYRGHRRVQHGGNLDGFTARVTFFPDANVGSVVLVNMESSPLPGYLSLDIADRQLGMAPKDWANRMLSRRDLQEQAREEAQAKQQGLRVPRTKPTHALEDYAGAYHHPGYGTVEVSHDRRTLTATYNNAVVTLRHWHYDVFNSELTRPRDDGLENKRFQFSRNVDGQLARLEINLEALTGPIVFRRQPNAAMSDPDYLARFVGDYRFLDQTWSVGLSGAQLVLQIPGQRQQPLAPALGKGFHLRDVPSIGVRFIGEADRVTGLQLLQPEGVYDLERIER